MTPPDRPRWGLGPGAWGSTGQHAAPGFYGPTTPMAPRPGLRLGASATATPTATDSGIPGSTSRWAPTGPADYFFRRYYSVPGDQMFMPKLLQPLRDAGVSATSRTPGCGGWHPGGGAGDGVGEQRR